MLITRRAALKLLAGVVPALRGGFAFGQSGPKIASGPFEGTRESLKAYRVPDWFRDAKFGIWAHWGPQSAPEYGDCMRGACISKVTSNTSISNVELLGHKAPLQWNQGEIGLKIQLPGEKPCDHAIVFKINGLEQK